MESLIEMIQSSFIHAEAASCSLASGSSGNSIYFQSAGTKLLVDCGISAKRIREGLASIDVLASDLTAILITHEHSDHVSGLEVLARHFNLPIFMSAGTYREWSQRVTSVYTHDVHLIEAGTSINIGDVAVNAFATPHDAAEPLGYKIDDGNHSVAVFTDLGMITPELLSAVSGSDLVYVEANYDVNMLWAGPYPWPLKQRIAGENGHLSNEDAGQVIADLLEDGSQEFILSHLSAENNMPSLADLTVQQILLGKKIHVGQDLRLRMAPRHVPGPLIFL